MTARQKPYIHGKRRKVNYSNGFNASLRDITSQKRKKGASVGFGRLVFKDWKGRKLNA